MNLRFHCVVPASATATLSIVVPLSQPNATLIDKKMELTCCRENIIREFKKTE
jgi:hypothetical protein